jgi:hypothetical protein
MDQIRERHEATGNFCFQNCPFVKKPAARFLHGLANEQGPTTYQRTLASIRSLVDPPPLL